VTAQDLPTWARELLTLTPACSNFLLSGNIGDKFLTRQAAESVGGLVAGADNRALLPVQDVLAEALSTRDMCDVLCYDITSGVRALPDSAPSPEQAGATLARAESILGVRPGELAPSKSLIGLARLIKAVGEAEGLVALVITSASRLVRDIGQLSPEEFDFYRSVDRMARDSAPKIQPTTARYIFNPIIWVLDNERDVPSWFSANNEYLRSIVLPMPNTDDRQVVAKRLLPALGPADDQQRAAGVKVLTENTAGMSLVAVERTIAIARYQGLGPDRVEDAARSYRVGVTDNPWRADYLAERLRPELLALSSDSGGERKGSSMLASRVLGQEIAVSKALDIIVRSVTSMTAAQAGPAATRPRGVLFFAGPTGVGKTELAKALTKLLFDDESFYIRFDMSEFSAEQAADRLIGAPPGYVGFNAGGELTNAIRQRPFSLILFDEIEKAHPRILDKFLQLLDDGRLTDGRGETVFFTESVIVFTSNLGIYSEVEETDDYGAKTRRRRPTVDRKTMDYPEMAGRVERSIRDYFTLQLGRPELLNRIGDNIVVFDFIDEGTGGRILDLMLDNIVRRVRQEHNVDIEPTAATRLELKRACLNDDTLILGGRGIGSMLETTVINPLAKQLFMTPPGAGAHALLHIEQRGDQWVADLQPR
jgi:energy-coupling factor transporter ATP-binding protein EcfA2